MSGLDRTFTVYGPGAGSARVRVFDWLQHLGWAPQRHTYLGTSSLSTRLLAHRRGEVAAAERDLRAVDVRTDRVLVSREVSPLSRGGLERRVLGGAARSTFDFDDALFHDRSLRRRLTGGAEKLARAVRSADVTIAGNEYLAEWAARHSERVVVVPSCVEPGDYEVAGADPGRPPTLVWLGSASTERYLVPLIPALLRVGERIPLRLRLISSPTPDPALDPLAHLVDRRPWRPETFAHDLAQADAAIAPLDDTPFARGKCAYKLLQYAAAGLPMAGSPVGANRAALTRFDGIPVGPGDDWAEAVVELLDEPAERSDRRRRAGLAAVREHYSFAAWASRWKDAVGCGSVD